MPSGNDSVSVLPNPPTAGGSASTVPGMRTTGTGTDVRRAAAGLALVALLLAGCGAAADSTAADAGGTAEELGSLADQGVGGDGDAAAASDAGAAAAPGGEAADAAGRQVITTGDVGLAAADPRAAADRVVAVVEQSGGRVDARQETAARAEDDVDATADLTVRVPATGLTGVLDALEDLGEVQSVDLRSEDVTAAAQDLDARIRAMRLSVARMEDLLSRATTTEDVIEAESTLTERQASLESLEAERARVAEQVALSTLHVTIWTSGTPVVTETEARTGFLGGLQNGWDALVEVLGVAALVLGALVPWLAVGAVVGVAVLLVRRALRRRRSPGAPGAGAGGPGRGGSAGPGEGPAGPDGPAEPAPDEGREPVGAGSPRP
ncbi:hypothetical protein CHO01_13400 [Cellulomonas hominis]|uniref:DUF4349 domain-containing protein n=3 Tax=Cellulomonas hominis TaxID=156981 RepID=A0A511FC89_9CELL|nr:hypothetical protein CHO01_13400 [Cellulomonas hominis]